MNYVTGSSLAGLRPRLTSRDLAIIQDIGRFKLMTGNQILRIFFQEEECSDLSRARRCQSVLSRLTKHGVLARLEERDTIKSFIYCLDIAGQHIAGLTSERPRRKYSWHSPQIPHTLAIAEVYTRVVEANRAGRLIIAGSTSYETEPYCWRDFADWQLKPDAYIEVDEVENGKRYRSNWYIEVDRSTQYGVKVTTKMPAYNAFWGYLQANSRKTRGVLILVHTEHRKKYFLNRVAQQPAAARPLYRVAQLKDAISILEE